MVALFSFHNMWFPVSSITFELRREQERLVGYNGPFCGSLSFVFHFPIALFSYLVGVLVQVISFLVRYRMLLNNYTHLVGFWCFMYSFSSMIKSKYNWLLWWCWNYKAIYQKSCITVILLNFGQCHNCAYFSSYLNYDYLNYHYFYILHYLNFFWWKMVFLTDYELYTLFTDSLSVLTESS